MSRYAVIGHPVQHSKSPQIHQVFAKQFGIDLQYDKIDPGDMDFARAVAQFHADCGMGLSVTLPYKAQAIKLADEVTERAAVVAVANTLWWDEAGVLWADNTDGAGLIFDLTKRLQWDIRGKRILLLGAGGVAAGILPALFSAQPAAICVANRTQERAQQLAERHRDGVVVELSACGLEDIPQQPFDLLLQATAMGHEGRCPVIPSAVIGDDTVCYDLSYGAAAKPFLDWAKKVGAVACADGIGMLVAQAALQFQHFHGHLPDIKPVLVELNAT